MLTVIPIFCRCLGWFPVWLLLLSLAPPAAMLPAMGILLGGSLLGAFIGELIFARNDAAGSVKAAIGAFLGFILSTGMKLIASGIMLFYIIRAVAR